MINKIIGIEASSILKQRTGIGEYNYQLLTHLVQLEKEIFFKVFTNSLKDRLQESLFLNSNNFQHYHSNVPGKMLLRSWEWLRFPYIENFVGKVDLFHSTNNNPVPQKNGIKLLTVYDLYFFRKPERTEKFGGQYFNRVLPTYIHDWDHVITISQAMKDEIVNLLSYPKEKISVIYCGLNDFYWEKAGDSDGKGLSLPDKFILAVGTQEPRKNYVNLLKAFRIFLDKGNRDFYLVISGGPGWGSQELYAAIEEFRLDKNVVLLGFTTKEQLRYCYQKAELFVMVSEYEGFGIPVLEAMASGVPVVASNITSLPEVVGDAGVLVDPFNEEAIAFGFETVLNKEEFSKELVKKGYDNAKRFTWREVAEKTLALYKRLLGKN